MIYLGAVIFALIFLIAGLIYNAKLVKAETEKKIEGLNINLIEEMNKPVYIGMISKYTQKDVDFLSANKEAVKTLMTYLEYQIAINTDLMRNTEDGKPSSEKIGYLNALHATHLFLYKIFHEKKKENKYSGQELR